MIILNILIGKGKKLFITFLLMYLPKKPEFKIQVLIFCRCELLISEEIYYLINRLLRFSQ
ncbi:hypothetical protein BTO16_09940 [Polaribacter glomeratus]|uniref:Uncharacterized protein n=1 Tax=Polaribacter glomeratus TaxID=102 RepID=A0A2S7WZF9_9FLAO|nr:hypothetical protein BTO16_09940 [Polaribacter glomeratus]